MGKLFHEGITMIWSLFNKKTVEIFTLFIPCSKNPYVSYREKTLDSVGPLFNNHQVEYEITKVINHDKGFWAIFKLSADLKNFESLKNDPAFKDYVLNNEAPPEEDLELIAEDDAEFSDYDNFKV